MKKRLYLISGTMGIGKTSVCQSLKRKLENAVFLDGDWCWDADPIQVNSETKRMVLGNICYLLNSFLHCSAYNHILFCWVMHEQNIIDDIVTHLDLTNCDVKLISLICRSDVLADRLERDIKAGLRQKDVLVRSIERLPLYDLLNTTKIDVSDLSIEETAKVIATL